ncbi:hypothetical protein AgCh_009441 [Apium graveolens]
MSKEKEQSKQIAAKKHKPENTICAPADQRRSAKYAPNKIRSESKAKIDRSDPDAAVAPSSGYGRRRRRNREEAPSRVFVKEAAPERSETKMGCQERRGGDLNTHSKPGESGSVVYFTFATRLQFCPSTRKRPSGGPAQGPYEARVMTGGGFIHLLVEKLGKMARLQQTQRKRVGSVPRLPVDVVAAIAAEVDLL